MQKTSSNQTTQTSRKSTRKEGTLRQKRVARKLAENLKLDKPITAGEILENVGYSKGIAENPKVVLQSAGVQIELKALGFDVETAKEVVGSILKDESVEPQHRIKAASEVFKVTGAYAAEKHVNLSMEVSKEERDKILGIATEVREKMTHEEING